MDTPSSQDAANEWIGRTVVDRDGEEIGTVDALWLDPSTHDVEFVGVKTGWILGKTHAVPAKAVKPAPPDQPLRLTCPSAVVKAAPSVTPGNELGTLDKETIDAHYGVSVPAARVTDISEVRPGEGTSGQGPEPQDTPDSLAIAPPPLPESEHTAAEHAFPSKHALDNLTNEAHGQ